LTTVFDNSIALSADPATSAGRVSQTRAARLLHAVVRQAASAGRLNRAAIRVTCRQRSIQSATFAWLNGGLRLVTSDPKIDRSDFSSAPNRAARDGCASIHTITALTFVRMSRLRAHRDRSAFEQSASVRHGRFADATLSTFPPASEDDSAGLIPFSFHGWKKTHEQRSRKHHGSLEAFSQLPDHGGPKLAG
jgi:hypothetical protein